MMEKIRTAANSLIVKIIFGIIILAFIFTGVGGFLGLNSTSADDERLYIAKVDGEGISRAGFEEQVNQALQQSFSLGADDSIKPIIRQRVFLSNVGNHLSYKLSEDLGVKVSDQQVKDAIRQQDVFFVNNAFNNERFLTLLRQNGYTPDMYAELIRADKQKEQLLVGLLLTDFALPVESALSELVGQQRKGYYAKVSINDVVDKAAIAVTPEELQQYYQTNITKFNRSDRVKVKYVVNSYSDAMQKVKIPTEQDIKDYYQANISQFMEPAKYEYSLIQAKDETDAKQIEQAIKKQNKDATSSSNLINLGWFTQATVPDYLSHLNLTKKGDSSTVNIDGEYYVAVLSNLSQTQKMPFEFVATKIKNELYDSQVQKLYNEANDKLIAARGKYQTLEEIAKETGLALSAPEDWQTRNEYMSIAANAELQNVLFSEPMISNGHATNNVSDIVEISEPKATYIVQVLDYRPEGIAPYEEVANLVNESLTTEKSKSVFDAELKKIAQALNSGESDNRINFANQYDVTRTSADLDQSTIDMIFGLIPPSQGKEVYGFDMNKYNSAVIAALTDVKNSDDKDLSQQITEVNKNQIFMSLNTDLRSKAKIEIMPNADL